LPYDTTAHIIEQKKNSVVLHRQAMVKLRDQVDWFINSTPEIRLTVLNDDEGERILFEEVNPLSGTLWIDDYGNAEYVGDD